MTCLSAGPRRPGRALARASVPVLLVALLAACGAPTEQAGRGGADAVPHPAEVPTAVAATPATPAAPDDPVAPAAPTAVAIEAVGIAAGVEEYTDAQVAAAGGWVDPVHRDVVAWWSGGGAPGNPADNTVYLYGHVSARPAVFNALAEVEVGDEVVLTTAEGALTYEVTAVLPPVPKAELPDVPEVAAVAPGRLVLIGCHREPDQGTRPTTENTVVIAEQVTSVARTPDAGS